MTNPTPQERRSGAECPICGSDDPAYEEVIAREGTSIEHTMRIPIAELEPDERDCHDAFHDPAPPERSEPERCGGSAREFAAELGLERFLPTEEARK